MLKPFTAIVFSFVLATIPACSQRGGAVGRGGSFASHGAGGFTMRAAPAFHAGPAFAAHANFSAPSHFNSFSSGARSAAVPFFNRRYLRDDRYRHAYARPYPLVVPYGVNGWVGPGYLDSGLYDDSSSAGTPPGYYADTPQDTAPPPPEQADVQPETAPAPMFRSAYVRPQPDPIPDTAVTLIFKDGRPAERIHNYMLTRTTLYVQEQHLRRIPVDQLDLEATAKANADAGVDFSLPGTAQ